MPVATAAVTAAQRKKRQQLAKRKAKLQQQQLADDQAAATAYAAIDTAGTGMDRAQCRQLLLAVTTHQQIDDDGLDMVMAAAEKSAGVSGAAADGQPCAACLEPRDQAEPSKPACALSHARAASRAPSPGCPATQCSAR